MIVTVTPNTGLDQVLLIDRLQPGKRNQASSRLVCMGGKGTDVSLILGRLGVSSLATGFAAGQTGVRMRQMLETAGVETDFVLVAGETRINTVLFERESGTHTTVCAEGLRVAPADLEALAATLVGRTGGGDVVVFAGSLPEGTPVDAYVPLIEAARARGAVTILDSSGPFLAAGLRARPWAVKPNREELESLSGPLEREGRSDEALRAQSIEAARGLLATGITRVIVSLGSAGLIAVEEGAAWVAEGLSVPVVNPAGAGDAVVAAMALGAEGRWSLGRTLREAVALATAVVVTPGTAECDVSRVADFRRQAAVRPYPDRSDPRSD